MSVVTSDVVEMSVLSLSLSHARYPPLFSPSQPKPRRRRRKRKRRRRRRWKWWVGKTTQLSWFIANNRIVVFFPCSILIFKDITIFCSCFDYYWRKQLYLQEQKNRTKSNRNHAEVAFLKWWLLVLRSFISAVEVKAFIIFYNRETLQL